MATKYDYRIIKKSYHDFERFFIQKKLSEPLPNNALLLSYSSGLKTTNDGWETFGDLDGVLNMSAANAALKKEKVNDSGEFEVVHLEATKHGETFVKEINGD